jgi:DNA-binding IscR family transcriptional regulator
VEALEGAGAMQGCVMGFTHCGPGNPCPLHEAWNQVKAQMGESMTKVTIRDLQCLNTRSKPLAPRGGGE